MTLYQRVPSDMGNCVRHADRNRNCLKTKYKEEKKPSWRPGNEAVFPLSVCSTSNYMIIILFFSPRLIKFKVEIMVFLWEMNVEYQLPIDGLTMLLMLAWT